jgi:endonuclease/exonuclease/phosphatase family metal-dependent hydrolase
MKTGVHYLFLLATMTTLACTASCKLLTWRKPNHDIVNRQHTANTKKFRVRKNKNALRVISANLRLPIASNKNSTMDWTKRLARITDLLAWYKPDIIGIQEATKNTASQLCSALKEYDLNFELIGFTAGNNDATKIDEYVAIAYNADYFCPETWGHSIISKGSQSDDPSEGIFKRIVSWAILRNWVTDKKLMVASTHFDHYIKDKSFDLRVKSAHRLKSILERRASRMPLVLMGDFNVFPDADGHECYKTLCTIADDVRDISASPHYGPDGTFPGFRPCAAKDASPDGSRLDHIFVKDCGVLAEGVLQNNPEAPYSDHHFVIADIITEH